MEESFLTIKEISKSPLKTISKKKDNKNLDIKDLTYELPLTTNDIFQLFEKNNQEIMSNLLNTKDLYISDWSCPYSVENNRFYFNQRCKGCQILYRLRKGNSEKLDEIEIYNGSKKGNKLILQKFQFFKDDYIQNQYASQISQYVLKSINPIYPHGIQKETYLNIENSKVNYITQSLIYNQIMKKENLELYNNYVWSYICGNDIHLIKEKNNISDMKELSSNPLFSVFHSPHRDIEKFKHNGVSKIVVLTVLKQLVMTLKIMSKYKFIHARPSMEYYHFIPEPISINKETYPLKFILECYDYSSISYQDKRFFCSNIGNFFNHGLVLESIDIDFNGSVSYCFNKNFSDDYNDKRIIFYRIGRKSNNFLKVRNQYGIPLCHQSFDFVMFLISIVIQQEFYVFKEMKEFKLWRNLWKSDEYPILEKKLFSLESNNFENVYEIIKNYYIRFDALQYFYYSLINQ